MSTLNTRNNLNRRPFWGPAPHLAKALAPSFTMLRDSHERNARRLELLTWALTVLTVALIGLTVGLIIVGVKTLKEERGLAGIESNIAKNEDIAATMQKQYSFA